MHETSRLCSPPYLFSFQSTRSAVIRKGDLQQQASMFTLGYVHHFTGCLRNCSLGEPYKLFKMEIFISSFDLLKMVST